MPDFIFPFILRLLPTDEKERWAILSNFSVVMELVHRDWSLGLPVFIQWHG